jgi:hypothetical protein
MCERLKHAIRRTYGWKSPVAKTKNQDFSLALHFVALVSFVLRLAWLVQVIKLTVLLVRGPEKDMPPLVNDVYVMGSVAIEFVFCIALWLRLIPSPQQLHLIRLVGFLFAWKIGETVTSNVYYLALRPVLQIKAPHSTYRSFVLALFGLLEVWLLLSLSWYYLGTTRPPIDSILTAAYFASATFFTVGYGDYFPVGDFSHAMAIISMFASISMIGIVLGRAVSLLRPLPEYSVTPETPAGEPQR